MITVTSIQNRTSTTIPWFTPSPEHLADIQKYIIANLLTRSYSESNDRLTGTMVWVWTTAEAKAEYDNLPSTVANSTARTAYNTTNGITITQTVVIL